jgi:hypothetical protein
VGGHVSAVPDTLWNNILFDQAAFGGSLSGLIGQSAGRIIYAALRKAGVTLGPQRTPSAAQMQDGIEELSRLLGSLHTDRYFIYSLDILTFALEAGKKVYTWGSGGDFDAPRPQEITHANVITENGALRYPLEIYTPQQWASVDMQDLPGTIPEGLFNDRASPLSNIYIYGQPATAMQLECYTWHLIPELESESDALFLPPGYADALTLNLACRLAPHFQRPVDPDVRQQARESLMRLESFNAPRPIASLGGLGCGCGGYDILSDQ